MNQPETTVSTEPPRTSFWRKLGGGSLSISIMVHGILLALGLVWVFQGMPQKAPEVDFMPKGGGGGSPGMKSEAIQKKRATMVPVASPRVAAKDVVSNFTLPEPDAATAMSSIGALGSSSMSGGLGGSGSGGGRGDGKGTGFGSGMGPGLGGSGIGANPFGMSDPNGKGLIGSFYDTKQNPKREPTEMTSQKLSEVINDFTKSWDSQSLDSKYYKAPQKLSQTKVYIPVMSADGAPKAFNCEKEVQPSRWIVIYRGNVTPPKTGKFRFVGAGDDVMVVRFNKKAVFDYGFMMGTVPLRSSGKSDIFAGKKENPVIEALIKKSPMEIPTTFYQYETTQNWNSSLCGVAVGPMFEAVAGQSYPIEILISEVPGGLFGACLMIQEEKVTYQKTSNGSPILPIFRLDGSLPPKGQKDKAPPYDPAGPVWKLTGGTGKFDI